MIENLVQMEVAYINTMHPELRISAANSILFYSDKRKSQAEKQENGEL